MAFFLFLARRCEILRDYFFHAQQELLHKRDSDQPGVPAARAEVVVTWIFFVFGAQM